jgi:hypothetical protein
MIDTPLALPPRYDPILRIVAATSYITTCGFLASQIYAPFRVPEDLRFAVIIWLLSIGDVAVVCWLLRPAVAHIAYAMRLGRANGTPPAMSSELAVPHFAGRRRVWGMCGTFAACCWTIAAAADGASAGGVLDLHRGALVMFTFVACQGGTVALVVRLAGPALLELNDVYELACRHAVTEANVNGTTVRMPLHPVRSVGE